MLIAVITPSHNFLLLLFYRSSGLYKAYGLYGPVVESGLDFKFTSAMLPQCLFHMQL